MFQIGYVQPYNTCIHGKTNNDYVENSFLTLYSLDYDDFANQEEFNTLNSFIVDRNKFTYYTKKDSQHCQHKSIQNYWKIYEKYSTQLQIVKIEELPTGESISIVNTFWLKLIQRKWKKILKERKRIVELRKKPSSLKYKQINGTWPHECRYMP